MKLLTRFSKFLALLVLASGGASSAYATSITVSASAPAAQAVDIRQTLADDASDMVRRIDNGAAASHQWFGQTFTVPASGMVVDQVAYLFQQEVDQTGRMTSGMTMGAVIYNLDGSDIMSGSVISSQSAVTPSFSQGANLWMVLDLNDVNLAPGSYGINFDFAFPLNNAQGGHKIGSAGMFFVSDGTDHYAGGQGWRVSGSGANNFSATRDLAFVITGTTPVPEPSTFVLAGLGIVGLAVRAVRRRSA